MEGVGGGVEIKKQGILKYPTIDDDGNPFVIRVPGYYAPHLKHSLFSPQSSDSLHDKSKTGIPYFVWYQGCPQLSQQGVQNNVFFASAASTRVTPWQIIAGRPWPPCSPHPPRVEVVISLEYCCGGSVIVTNLYGILYVVDYSKFLAWGLFMSAQFCS